MWRIVLAVLALPMTATATAGAATIDISITKSAYAPSTVAVSTADTVKFTNNDASAHQVAFKTTGGVTCSPTPFVLQPAQSGTCTFTTAGTFSYSDPTAAALQGTLTVSEPAPPTTLSLFAQPDVSTYSSRVRLTGELSSKKAGENVVVIATPCGRSEATKAATVQTTSGGEYTIDLRPGRNTIFTVQSGTTKSDTLSVKVHPRVRLGRVGAHRYSVRVFAALRFAGKSATIQRYDTARGRWVFVKRVRLHSNSTNILPTVISSVAFRSTLAPRTRIRAILPQFQAGTCYLPGTSNAIHS